MMSAPAVFDTISSFLCSPSLRFDLMPKAHDSSTTTFDWPVRVYYEDTDAAGVVFYANYLRFLERGRTEWLRSLGYEQDALRAQDAVVFAVRRVVLDYRAPARFNDQLTVRTSLRHLGGASLEFDQAIVRDRDGTLCCEGTVGVVCLDANSMRPRRAPAGLVSGILSCIERGPDGPVE